MFEAFPWPFLLGESCTPRCWNLDAGLPCRLARPVLFALGTLDFWKVVVFSSAVDPDLWPDQSDARIQ